MRTGSPVSVATALVASILLTIGTVPLATAQQQGDVANGKKIYEKKRCDLCHTIAGKGKPKPGPDLTKEGMKNRGIPWQIEFMKNPKSKDPKGIMPPVKDLSEKEYLDLATYLESLK